MISSRWMPFTTSMIWWTGSEISLSGFGATSTGQLSEPTSSGSCLTSHSAAATPIPGQVFMKRALSLANKRPHPVWIRTASPGRRLRFCRCSACWRSCGVISYVSPRMSTPLRAATSISTPRVISMPTFSMPSFEPRARGDLVGLEAVVVAVLDRLVGEAIELRADLPDLAQEHLFVAAAPVGLRVHERPLDVDVELARGGDRHLRREDVPQLDDLAGLDELRSAHDGRRLHVVGGAALVAGAPLRGAALAVGGRAPGLSGGDGGHEPQRQRQGDTDSGSAHGILPGGFIAAAREG